MKIIRKTLLFVVFCYSINIVIYAQEITATVDVVTEGLTNEQITQVESLKYSIETYINSNQFSATEWEGPKIPVNIGIQVNPIGPRNYSANLFIASRRTISEADETSVINMRFEDNGKWNFEYSQGQSLSYDFNRYDALSSVIDFYMLMVIGCDLDTYGELDGDQCFQRASRIFDVAVSRGAGGWSMYNTSEYGRNTIIGDLTSPRMDPFRKLIFEYYVDGLDLMESNREIAIANIAGIIDKMADFKEKYLNLSHLMDTFFSTKCSELCEIFRKYDDAKVFRNLMFLDPTNSLQYENSKAGK